MLKYERCAVGRKQAEGKKALKDYHLLYVKSNTSYEEPSEKRRRDHSCSEARQGVHHHRGVCMVLS
uniref:Uncharacterized protein n=1 Tax=Aegilops tauschii subsp. strangulata TaxID=200361 RepID=A0A453DK63_AEGTS